MGVRGAVVPAKGFIGLLGRGLACFPGVPFLNAQQHWRFPRSRGGGDQRSSFFYPVRMIYGLTIFLLNDNFLTLSNESARTFFPIHQAVLQVNWLSPASAGLVWGIGGCAR